MGGHSTLAEEKNTIWWICDVIGRFDGMKIVGYAIYTVADWFFCIVTLIMCSGFYLALVTIILAAESHGM